MEDKIYRILDANFNRAREGLRVCEEIARFVLDDRNLTRGLKEARHKLTAILQTMGMKSLIEARASERDVGRGLKVDKEKRSDTRDVFLANIERVKESLRVLEEFSKLLEKDAEELERVRFDVYSLEREAVGKLDLSDN